MPFPWEAALPFVAFMGFMQMAGSILDVTQRADNLGKTKRMQCDDWEIGMMDRDRRLTGHKRGQRDDPNPPAWFQTNKIWRFQDAGTGDPIHLPGPKDLKRLVWDH